MTSRLFATFLLFFASVIMAQTKKWDINQASLAECEEWVKDSVLAEEIYWHKIRFGKFKSIYDLFHVEGMTVEFFAEIKKSAILPIETDENYRFDKIEDIYYKIDQLASEGNNDNEADQTIDIALNPRNINEMTSTQLMNLPSISPIAVARIRSSILEGTPLNNHRELRNVSGLSYFSYFNIKDFIDYQSKLGYDSKLHGFLTVRYFDNPYIGEEGDAFGNVGYLNVEKENTASQYWKGRFNYNQYKFGFSNNRNLGEAAQKNYKFYASISDLQINNNITIHDLIFGNFAVAFGQGLVMENTDFFIPRKNGFGFKKRYIGVLGDISRSRNHDLFGMAFHANFYQDFELIAFLSQSKRDAILNNDGSVNTFINLKQRMDADYLYHYSFASNPDNPNIANLIKDSVPNMLNNTKEFTFGASLKYHPTAGSFLGINIVESWYDRLLRPQISSLYLDPSDFDERFRNNELNQGMYGGPSSDFTGGGDWKSFRRIIGFEAQAVINDWAFVAEFAFIDRKALSTLSYQTNDTTVIDGNSNYPSAFLAAAFLQKENFEFLLLYRNYDMNFDNPYQHSFSNYQRYKGTTIKDPFRLKSPYYTQLFYNADQPQAEHGFYIHARYRVSKEWTFITESDLWQRNSDAVEQYRLVIRNQYRPIYPLRIEWRQKWQSRDYDNVHSIDYFYNSETRLSAEAFLSGRDMMRLTIGRSYTQFPIRPNLVFNPNPNKDPYDNVRSANLSEGQALSFEYRHNYNNYLSFKGQVLAYKGFYWNFEDTQFNVLNSINGSLRYWISVINKLNDQISLRLKFTHEEKTNDRNRFIRSTSSYDYANYDEVYYTNVEETGNGNNIFLEINYSF